MNSKDLKLGDKIRFVKRPDEWKEPGYCVHSEDVDFMDELIRRGESYTITDIDEHPWIEVWIGAEHHIWALMENSGWEVVSCQDGSS